MQFIMAAHHRIHHHIPHNRSLHYFIQQLKLLQLYLYLIIFNLWMNFFEFSGRPMASPYPCNYQSPASPCSQDYELSLSVLMIQMEKLLYCAAPLEFASFPCIFP